MGLDLNIDSNVENNMAAVTDSSSRLEGRTITPEGFLRADAVVTSVGVFNYLTTELDIGGPPRVVRVFRTPESVFHPDTINSARMKPLTLRHPQGKFVLPHNAKMEKVGSMGENPFRLDDRRLAVPIMVTDSEAIQKIEGGRDATSSGQIFYYIPKSGTYMGQPYDLETEGPILINHLAIEQQGRDDHSRMAVILDSHPADQQENIEMDEEQVKQMLEEAKAAQDEELTTKLEALKAELETANKEAATELKDGLSTELAESLGQTVTEKVGEAVNAAKDGIVDSVKEALGESLVTDVVEQVRARMDEASAEQDAEAGDIIAEAVVDNAQQNSQAVSQSESQPEADKEAEPALATTADSQQEQIYALAQERADLIVKAQQFLKGRELGPMSNREILIAAVGDSVENADYQSDDYLMGHFDQLARSRGAASTQRDEIRTGSGSQKGKSITEQMLPSNASELRKRNRLQND